MLDKLDGPWKYIVSILAFPLFFQTPFIEFAWGADDQFSIMLAKRLLILLPSLAIVFCCWATVVNALTIIFRQDRREFATLIFITWWDLGRAIFAYWAGILRFGLCFLGWIYGFVRLLALGISLILKDLVLFPIRIAADLSSGSFQPGVPWPALFLMTVWTLIEALIFTFVMTPLVVDVLDGFSDGEMRSGLGLQIVLYLMFSIFVLGSYAVIHTLGEAVRDKDYGKIVLYAVIEAIVAVVETVLFYREFVDALIPWFAQYAGDNFDLGLVGTLSIAFFIWLGFRCMTWFLFGKTAIPMMLAMIQRTGLKDYGQSNKSSASSGRFDNKALLAYVHAAIDRFRSDLDWVEHQGDVVLSFFIIPPLQIVAASINFCTLAINSSPLFHLPFRSYKDILEARDLIRHARDAIEKKR